MRMFQLAMNHRALIAFHRGALPKELKQRIGVIISDEPRINDEIRVPQVRLIGPKGEIRFRLKIDDHDFDVKKGHVTRFLNGGDKVKVTIMLRGREISRPIGGVELLQRLADDVEEFGTVESKPKQEGRNIIMTLAPKGKKVHTQSEQRRRGAESRAERQARQAARLAAKQESQAQAAADAKTAISQKTSDKKQTSKEGSNAEDEN